MTARTEQAASQRFREAVKLAVTGGLIPTRGRLTGPPGQPLIRGEGAGAEKQKFHNYVALVQGAAENLYELALVFGRLEAEYASTNRGGTGQGRGGNNRLFTYTLEIVDENGARTVQLNRTFLDERMQDLAVMIGDIPKVHRALLGRKAGEKIFYARDNLRAWFNATSASRGGSIFGQYQQLLLGALGAPYTTFQLIPANAIVTFLKAYLFSRISQQTPYGLFTSKIDPKDNQRYINGNQFVVDNQMLEDFAPLIVGRAVTQQELAGFEAQIRNGLGAIFFPYTERNTKRPLYFNPQTNEVGTVQGPGTMPVFNVVITASKIVARGAQKPNYWLIIQQSKPDVWATMVANGVNAQNPGPEDLKREGVRNLYEQGLTTIRELIGRVGNALKGFSKQLENQNRGVISPRKR